MVRLGVMSLVSDKQNITNPKHPFAALHTKSHKTLRPKSATSLRTIYEGFGHCKLLKLHEYCTIIIVSKWGAENK